MRLSLLLIFMVLTSAFAKAQQTQNTTSVAVTSIASVYQDDFTAMNEVSIRLVEVLEDSRCPKGVQCIRAGEAKIIVEVVDGQGKSFTKKVTIGTGGVEPFYTNDGSEIRLKKLSPYPNVSNKINPEDYFLKVEVRG